MGSSWHPGLLGGLRRLEAARPPTDLSPSPPVGREAAPRGSPGDVPREGAASPTSLLGHACRRPWGAFTQQPCTSREVLCLSGPCLSPSEHRVCKALKGCGALSRSLTSAAVLGKPTGVQQGRRLKARRRVWQEDSGHQAGARRSCCGDCGRSSPSARLTLPDPRRRGRFRACCQNEHVTSREKILRRAAVLIGSPGRGGQGNAIHGSQREGDTPQHGTPAQK